MGGRMDRRMDTTSYRDAESHLKRKRKESDNENTEQSEGIP